MRSARQFRLLEFWSFEKSVQSAEVRIFVRFVSFCAELPELCRPYRALWFVRGRYPRASLRCTLGYHIVVPSGLAETGARRAKLRFILPLCASASLRFNNSKPGTPNPERKTARIELNRS